MLTEFNKYARELQKGVDEVETNLHTLTSVSDTFFDVLMDNLRGPLRKQKNIFEIEETMSEIEDVLEDIEIAVTDAVNEIENYLEDTRDVLKDCQK